MQLDGKTVCITGAASGIGRAAALACAQQGARLLLADIDVPGGEETAQQVTAAGGTARFVRTDVTSADDVQAMTAAALAAYDRLDVMVNNAGVSGELVQRLHEVDDAVFDRITAVNLKGVWLGMKAALRVMLGQPQGGVIVNVASVAGLVGFARGAAYAASKHAVVGLTKSAALEYARDGVRINAVCPSFVDTPMVQEIAEIDQRMDAIMQRASPMRRLGQAEEVAAAIVWLASDAASFVNGHMLAVDGGLTAM